MSSNKFRFYDVATLTTVKALTQADALAIAKGNKRIPGEIMAVVSEVERVSASEAREWAEEVNS